MRQDRDKSSLTKLFGYLFLSSQRDAQWNIYMGSPPTHRQRSSPEEMEKQKRQYQRFLLLHTLGS